MTTVQTKPKHSFSLKKWLLAFIAAAMLAIGGTAVAAPAPPASASAACTVFHVCGNIEMKGSYALRIKKDWDGPPPPNYTIAWDRLLYPGQGTRRTLGWSDTDKIVLPPGSCLTLKYGNGTYSYHGSRVYWTVFKVQDTHSLDAWTYFC